MNNTLRQVYILLFAALFFIAGNTATAQTSENDLKKEATKYFESEDFAHAYPLYSQLLSLHPDNADYNYRFGTCMLFTKEDKEKPIDYLLFALKSATTDKLAYYYLGGAYQLNYRFDDAIEAYNKFKQSASSSEVKSHPADHLIQMCGDGKTLLKDVHDLDVLQKKELSLADYFHAYDLSANGGTMLIEPDDFKSKLDKKKGFSSVIYLSPDRNEIFYSSYGDDGANGLDIYTVKRLPTGGFSKPTNLGTIINTPYDEEYPFYDAPTHTLYFSSKGHNSMGGYDVFKSVHNEAIDVWSTPVNMDFPINTPDDDILFIADTLGQTAFFASTRSSPSGSIDVYKIKIHQHAPENVLLKGIAFADMGRTPISAKITVKSYETNKLIGVYNSNHDDGGYFMTLPNGMQVVYTVEAPGHTTQTEAVVIPKQEELATLKQEIGYDSATDRLIITNHFESSGANQDYLLALDYIRSKAKLEVNVDSNTLNVNNAIAQNSVQSNSIDNTDHNAANTDSGIPHYNNNLTTSANNANSQNNNAANQNNNSATNSSSTNNNSTNNQNTASSQNNNAVANNNNSSPNNNNSTSANNNSSTDNNSNNTSSQNNTSVANNSNSSSNNNNSANSTNNSSVTSNNQNNNTSQNSAANNPNNNQSSNTTDNSTNEQLVQAANNDAQQKQQDALATKNEANKATQFANDKMQEAQNLTSEAQELTDKANTYSDEKQKNDTLAKATTLRQEAKDDLNKANEAYQVAAQEQNDAQTKSKQADLVKQYSVSLDSASKTANSKDAVAQVQAKQNALTQQQQTQSANNNITASSLILQQAQNTKQDSTEVAHNIEQLKKDADGLQQQSQNYIDQAQKTDNAQEKVALLQQAKDLSDSKKHKEEEIKTNERLEQQLHNEYTAEVGQAKSADQQGSPQISSADVASTKNEIDHYTPSSTNNVVASTQNNSQNNNSSNSSNSSANNSLQASNNNTNSQNSSTNNATSNNSTSTDNNATNSANNNIASNNQNNSSSANNNTNSTNSNQSSSANNTQVVSNNSSNSNTTNANNNNSTNATNNSTVQFNNTQGVNNVVSTTQVDYSNQQAADANKAAATYATESDNASKEASDTRKQAREATDPAEARLLSKKADSLDNVADQKKIQSSVATNTAGANQFTANKGQIATWQNTLQNTSSDKLTTAMLLYNDANFYYNKSLIAKQKADSNSKSYIKQGFLDEENKNLATALLKQQEAKNIYLSVDPKLASVAANNAPINTTALNNSTNNNPDNSQQIAQNNNPNNNTTLNSSGNNSLQANTTATNQNSASNSNNNTANNTSQPDNNSQGNQNTSANNSNNTSNTNQSGNNNSTANNSQSAQNNAVNNNSNSSNSNQANNNTNTATNNQVNQNNSSNNSNNTSSNATDNNTNTANNNQSNQNNGNNSSVANNGQSNQSTTDNNNQNNSANNNSQSNSNNNTNNSNNSSQPDNNSSTANNSQGNQNNSTNNSSTNSNQANNTTTANNNSNNSSSNQNNANNSNSVQNANRIDSLLSSNTNQNSANQNNNTANNSQNNNNATAQNSSNNNTSSQNNSANNVANSNSNNSTANNNTANSNQANNNPDNNATNNNQGNQNTAANNSNTSNTNQSGNNSNTANNSQSSQNTSSNNTSVANNNNSAQNANRIDSLLSSNNNQANQNNSANNTNNSSLNNAQNNTAVTTNSNNNNSSTQANNSGNANNATNPDNTANSNNTSANNRNSVTINITEDVFAESGTSPYSPNKPIPIDQPLPEGLVFKVQIGAFRNAIQQNLFKGLQPISGEKTATGLTRYFAGIFKDYPGAKTAQGKVQDIGYKDAFVVAFYNGKRISLAQARAMLGGNENTQVAANNTQNNTNDNNTATQQTQQTQNNLTANNTVSVATSVSDVKGLFFSVQVGALQHPAPASSFYNLRPLFSYNAPNGYIRYNCGIYSNLPNAKVAKQEIILKTPIKDAFIVAYSNGQRITINQASQLLSTGGTVPQSPDLDRMPNGPQIQNSNQAPQTNNAVNNNPAPTPVNLPAVTNNPIPQTPVKDTTSPAPANNQPVNNTPQSPVKDTTANIPANVPAPVTNNTTAPQTPVKDTTANVPAQTTNNTASPASSSIGSRSFSSNTIAPAGDVTVSVTIHRGNISGFAKLEETIPDGFTATEGEKQGATFKFADGKVQWVWLGLPNDSVFTVTYKLTALSTTFGTQSISGRFLYTLNNEKQEVAIPASTIIVGSSGNNTNVTPVTSNTSNADTGKAIFTVQVGSFSGPIPVDMANKLLQISKQGIKAHKEDNGITSYTVGEYHDYTSADEMKKELVTDGYDKSFVVAYFNGKKISLEQAQLLNNK